MPTAQEYASFFIDLETIPLSSCVSSKKKEEKRMTTVHGPEHVFCSTSQILFR